MTKPKLGRVFMNIKLYYAPITCAMVSYVALTEAGADFETIPSTSEKQST